MNTDTREEGSPDLAGYIGIAKPLGPIPVLDPADQDPIVRHYSTRPCPPCALSKGVPTNQGDGEGSVHAAPRPNAAIVLPG